MRCKPDPRPWRQGGAPWATALLALVAAGQACAQPATQARIAATVVTRSNERGFDPGRTVIVDKGPQLASYEIRFQFRPTSPLPVDFQTISCTAKRRSGGSFAFVYRNQSIPANRDRSDAYKLIVPVFDVSGVACAIGNRAPAPDSMESRQVRP